VGGTDFTTASEEDFRRLRIRIGMLFQNNALMGSNTVLENAAVPLEQHTSLPPELIRLDIGRKLELLGIGGTIDKLPAELSGGMQKRAALARAIAMDPEILFCDEPTSGLDPITSKRLDALIAGLREKLDMTVVVVSHDVASIGRLADRIVFLDEGSIVFDGSFDEALYSDHPAVADFFSDWQRE
jgi:phospholipid/cholesterol/gamma-HCH transport system ATP-binding protein